MILDYIWKSLFLGGVSATVFLAVMFAAYAALKKSSAVQIKWYLNSQLVILATLLGGGFVVAALDRELMAGCFESFVQQSSGWAITRWMAAGWLSGFLFLLGMDVARCLWIIRKAKTFRPLENGRIQILFSELKNKMGIRRQVGLYSVSETLSPFAYGLFQHKIILPSAPIEESILKSALAHELIHVRDRDSAWLFLELLCRRILFWHPLAYVLGRLYVTCVEKAADESAVEKAQIPTKQFLTALIEMATLYRANASSPLRVSVSRGYRETRSRVEALANNKGRRSALRLPVLMGFAVLPLLVSIAEAGVARKAAPYDPKMCMQVTHEKMIESWLRIETTQNKCEK